TEAVSRRTDSECVGRGCAAGTTAGTRCERAHALNGLNEAVAEEWDQYETNAVQASINNAVAPAEDGLVRSEQSAEETVVEVRIPSRSNARAESLVERVVRIFGFP